MAATGREQAITVYLRRTWDEFRSRQQLNAVDTGIVLLIHLKLGKLLHLLAFLRLHNLILQNMN